MKYLAWFVIVVAVVLVGLKLWMTPKPGGTSITITPGAPTSTATLEILCAPALRQPVSEMLDAFEKKTGIKSQIAYDASNLLLGQLKLKPHGDLFIPADRFYTDEAVKAGLATDATVFAYLEPVIMVQKGNPFGITSLVDLKNPKVKTGLVDARTGAIGRVSAELLTKNAIKDDALNVVYHATKVDELGNAIKLKSVDAVIIWRSIAMLYPDEAEIVTIPPKNNITTPVSAAVVKASTQPEIARQFLAFLTSPEGRAILERHHYTTQTTK